jgi:hypothetical protein
MHRHLRFLSLLFVFGTLTAMAQEESTEPSTSNFIQGLEVQVGTEIPVQFGVRVRADLPEDFYVLSGVGYSPPFMANAIGSLANSLGMLGPNTSKVASLALNNAFVLDLGFGYKFRTSHNFFDGFFVDIGYQLMVGGGGDENITTVEGATGNIYALSSADTVNVKSTLNSITGHVGYTYTGFRHLVVTGEVGIIKPLAAVNRVTPNANLTDPVDYIVVQNDVNNVLNSALKNNLVIPTLSIWLSYMF